MSSGYLNNGIVTGRRQWRIYSVLFSLFFRRRFDRFLADIFLATAVLKTHYDSYFDGLSVSLINPI